MKYTVHRAESRGGGDYGWLKTRHSFSFANWYDPLRMGFGALRVLNDDVIAPQSGFGMHPHSDMEIVTIVMKGEVTHEDSLGNQVVIGEGEVQVMSAGTGVVHSEKNNSASNPLELFQIWIEPNVLGVAPQYAQKRIGNLPKRNIWHVLVSEKEGDSQLLIRQDARIRMGRFSDNKMISVNLKNGHGVYLMVVSGEISCADTVLYNRDAVGVSEVEVVTIHSRGESCLLAIDVPM